MDGIKQEHERNEQRIHELEKEVARVTSPRSSSGADASSSSKEHHHSTVASQLFNRSKPSKSKSKSKKSGSGSSSSSTTCLNDLTREVERTRDSETSLVSSAIGISPDGQELVANGSDDVLDLADQLLAQLDARRAEEEADGDETEIDAKSSSKRAGSAASRNSQQSTASSGNHPASASSLSPHPATSGQIVAPIPIPGASATGGTRLAGDAAFMRSPSPLNPNAQLSHPPSASSTPSLASTATTSTDDHDEHHHHHHHHGLGHALKKVFSPQHSHDSEHSTSPSSKMSDPARWASQHDFPGSSTGSVTSSTSSLQAPSPAPSSASSHHTVQGAASPNHATKSPPPPVPVPRAGRQQLRKERKKARDDAIRAQAQAEVDAMGGKANDPAEKERAGIDKLLVQYSLEMVQMEPDGNCMYRSVADQLVVHKYLKQADYHLTRKVAAEYMRGHIDDFLPYLPAEDEEGQGEGLLSPEGYRKHCDHVEKTSEWGSETEVRQLRREISAGLQESLFSNTKLTSRSDKLPLPFE